MTAMTSSSIALGRSAYLALLALLFLGVAQIAAAVEPTQVLVTLPPGATAQGDYEELLSVWRNSGQVANVLQLVDEKSEAPGFANLVVLEFDSDGSYQSWRKTEAPKLKAPLQVMQADVLLHGEKTPRDSNKSIFHVNAYDVLVSPTEYAQYVKDYIGPNMANQKDKKILLRYTMYLDREKVGGKLRALLVMEYRDAVAYGRRDAVKDEYKAWLLANDAKWKRINDTKDSVRQDAATTIAAYRELPPPQLPGLTPYKPDVKLKGSLRISGSELKNAVEQLAAGFRMFHPDVKVTVSSLTSSEGAIAGLYTGISDVAPMGDDAKITDVMPFYNTFGYMPTEISVATGGYEKRGSLWAWAIVVNKDNPLNEISVDELERVFGAERTGGWELVENDYRFTSKYARGKESNIRTWGQLGLKGDYAKREIETFGYAAPGFAIAIERNWFHWSKKWNPNFREYVELKQTSPGREGEAVASERPLEDLKTNKYSIGIAGLMHVKDYPYIKVLNISQEKGGPAIALTPETVANRSYPLIRDAYFYVNREPGKPLDPKVREFMRFVLSREGQEIIARVGYYYPLTPQYAAEQAKKLD
ncbi:MAG: substrate-binding domain-containing protein [Steroidobacteraceae bacterium]